MISHQHFYLTSFGDNHKYETNIHISRTKQQTEEKKKQRINTFSPVAAMSSPSTSATRMTYAQALQTHEFDTASKEVMKVFRDMRTTLQYWKIQLTEQHASACEDASRASDVCSHDYHLRDECLNNCRPSTCWDSCPCYRMCKDHAQESEYEKVFQEADAFAMECDAARDALARFTDGFFTLKDLRILKHQGVFRSYDDVPMLFEFFRRWCLFVPTESVNPIKRQLLDQDGLCVFFTGQTRLRFPSIADDTAEPHREAKAETNTIQLLLEVDHRTIWSHHHYISYQELVKYNPWFGNMFGNETLLCDQLFRQ